MMILTSQIMMKAASRNKLHILAACLDAGDHKGAIKNAEWRLENSEELNEEQVDALEVILQNLKA